MTSFQLPSSTSLDVIVLPRTVDSTGLGVYDDAVLTLAKELRADGVAADYLHDTSTRTWHGERSATAALITIGLGIVSSAGWAAVARLFRGRAKSTTKIQLRISRLVVKDGETSWEQYELEGSGPEIAAAMDSISKPLDWSNDE